MYIPAAFERSSIRPILTAHSPFNRVLTRETTLTGQRRISKLLDHERTPFDGPIIFSVGRVPRSTNATSEKPAGESPKPEHAQTPSPRPSGERQTP